MPVGQIGFLFHAETFQAKKNFFFFFFFFFFFGGGGGYKIVFFNHFFFFQKCILDTKVSTFRLSEQLNEPVRGDK